ncbi:putative quinol monooxygenase [Halomonas citrativorans]|uniref:putative quinol monooxygenase n=1 Tax=Halomonas citrativorans TaxID=2742612 RepID=UPI000B351B2B|nr:putative quinol monooxygenase [Halomonas citrativorans]
MIYVVATSIAKEGFQDLYRESLISLVTPTRKEKGCLLYDLHQDKENASHFIFYEIWDNQSSLDKHSISEHLLAHQERTKEWLVSNDIYILDRIA